MRVLYTKSGPVGLRVHNGSVSVRQASLAAAKRSRSRVINCFAHVAHRGGCRAHPGRPRRSIAAHQNVGVVNNAAAKTPSLSGQVPELVHATHRRFVDVAKRPRAHIRGSTCAVPSMGRVLVADRIVVNKDTAPTPSRSGQVPELAHATHVRFVDIAKRALALFRGSSCAVPSIGRVLVADVLSGYRGAG